MGCLWSNSTVEPAKVNSEGDPKVGPVEKVFVVETKRDYSSTLRKHFDLQISGKQSPQILRPHEIQSQLPSPHPLYENKRLDRSKGSLFGLAIGDALGAHVEFRPHEYMLDHQVKDLTAGGTWGLEKGQFTDDTSMALCLAISLIVCGDFVPYDQLVRYRWWYQHGYMSSTGTCFDIGAATKNAVVEFEQRQVRFCRERKISKDTIDNLTDKALIEKFDYKCGAKDAAGNGSLMRLAPVPLFFSSNPQKAVEFSGESSDTTHGDPQARDACRFYGALIVGAVQGLSKNELLNPKFYENYRNWFGEHPLHDNIMSIVRGSYKKKGPDDPMNPIRGKGFVVPSLEAALWAFHNDGDSFETGVLAAVNLGDDTDTTAAIYGQLAGAYYGFDQLPKRWVKQIYANELIERLGEWIVYRGEQWIDQTKPLKQTKFRTE